MTSDADILNGIRESYYHTNIRDVDLEAVLDARPEVRIGYLLQNMENESSKQFRINFDPVENLFLNKLVNEDVFEHRVNLKAQDFFKGIVFLDYLSTIILDDFDVIDEVDQIARELEHRDKYLDPDLGLVAKIGAMHYLSQAGRRLIRQRGTEAALERYQSKNKNYEPEYVILRKISPAYEALGAMVHGLVQTPEIQEQLPYMTYLYDIKAALFTDTVLCILTEEPQKQAVLSAVSKGKYYEASILAITSLSKEVTVDTLDGYISSFAGEAQ
jgi:hypothetical protein